MRATLVLIAVLLPGCRKAPEWKEHTSPEGRYRVRMPENAKEKELTGPDGPVKALLSEAKEGAFSVTFTDLKDEPKADAVEPRLKAAAVGAAAKVGGKEMEQKKVALKVGETEHVGLEVWIDAPKDKVRLRKRFFLVGKRLYDVTTAGTEAWVSSDDSKRFLDSFTLIKE